MKKIILTAFVLFILVGLNNIQAQGYQAGSKTLNLGVGFGMAGIEGEATLPPISAGLQFGLTDKISVGGIVGYSGSSYKFGFFGSNYEWKYSYIIIGARGEYHLLEPNNKLDAYGGVTVGYQLLSVTEPSNLPKFGNAYSAKGSAILFGFHVGGRYALSNSFGVFGELGYGMGYVTVGAFLRL